MERKRDDDGEEEAQEEERHVEEKEVEEEEEEASAVAWGGGAEDLPDGPAPSRETSPEPNRKNRWDALSAGGGREGGDEDAAMPSTPQTPTLGRADADGGCSPWRRMRRLPRSIVGSRLARVVSCFAAHLRC